MRTVASVVAFLAQVSLVCCSTADGASNEMVAVAMSLSLKDDGAVDLSIYNPQDFPVCTPVYHWLGGVESDMFTVFGKDGKPWMYSGGEYDTIGDVPQTRVAPLASIEWSGPIQSIYKPPAGASDQVGKVYYTPYFVRC